MRVVLLVLTFFFLAGCPPYVKVYVHNDSDDTIRVESLRAQSKMTTIRAGRARTIQAGSMDDVCFELSAGGDVRIYSIDPNSGPYINNTTYGGRLNFYYEDGAMYVGSKTGERFEIFPRLQCAE
jgi:hypothetical protein